jgi:hypothetical protein
VDYSACGIIHVMQVTEHLTQIKDVRVRTRYFGHYQAVFWSRFHVVLVTQSGVKARFCLNLRERLYPGALRPDDDYGSSRLSDSA